MAKKKSTKKATKSAVTKTTKKSTPKTAKSTTTKGAKKKPATMMANIESAMHTAEKKLMAVEKAVMTKVNKGVAKARSVVDTKLKPATTKRASNRQSTGTTFGTVSRPGTTTTTTARSATKSPRMAKR